MTPAAGSPVAAGTPSADDLRDTLATNLRRIRSERGYSLRDLAARSQVSKALLSRLERGDGNPALDTLFRIAAALDCAVSELIDDDGEQLEVVRAHEGRRIQTDDARMVNRLIFASSGHRRVEVFECLMEPNTRSEWAGEPSYGVTEFAIVTTGQALVGPVGREALLRPGDAISFRHGETNAYASLDESTGLVCLVAYDA